MIGAGRIPLTQAISVVSRLFVWLALALFSFGGTEASRLAQSGGPSAEIQVETSDGIVAGKRHAIRALVPEDDSTEKLTPEAAHEPAAFATSELVAAHPGNTTFPTAIRILPPVRAPPFA